MIRDGPQRSADCRHSVPTAALIGHTQVGLDLSLWRTTQSKDNMKLNLVHMYWFRKFLEKKTLHESVNDRILVIDSESLSKYVFLR